MQQLVIDWVAAQMLSGEKNLLKTINTDAHWFPLFESEYGLSFKHANRRYEVQEHVRKRRMEIFWVNLFKVRKFIQLTQGYDPVLWNFDQTPYYQDEVGAQNKPTLAVQGGTVPIVEGKSAAHARWTALLSCCSSEEVIRQRWPFCEAMYKYSDCGPKEREPQGHLRDQNYPPWLSVTVCLLYTSPSPRDKRQSRMPSSA